MNEFYNIPPQSLEIEESLLAAFLLYPETLPDIVDLIGPDDFYRSAHQKIFNACITLHKLGEPVDLVSVRERLKTQGELEAIGGATYLATITEAPISINPEHSAKIIKNKSILRRTIELSNQVARKCFESREDPAEIINSAQQELHRIEQSLIGKTNWHDLDELSIERVDAYEEMNKNYGNITGIPSGFPDLDYLTAGFQKADFILLAARPSMGKTSLALNLLDNIGESGNASAIFSLEQPKEQLYDRLLSSRSRVNLQRFRTGRFQSDDWMRISDIAGGMIDLPIWIDDSPGLHYSEIKRRARYLKRKQDIKAFFIDYLQLCYGDGAIESNEFITSISRAFKELAKELNVPVIALSQLNRSLEKRSNDKRRPLLSDLRGSGSLEQDADVVMFLYRDEVYNDDENNPNKGIAELNISKQRNGPTGVIKLAWLDRFTRFESLARD